MKKSTKNELSSAPPRLNIYVFPYSVATSSIDTKVDMNDSNINQNILPYHFLL